MDSNADIPVPVRTDLKEVELSLFILVYHLLSVLVCLIVVL